MEDENLEIREWTAKLIEKLDLIYRAQQERVDQRLDTMEQQLAALTAGYAEMAAIIETIIGVMNNVDPDEFKKVYEKNVKNMFEVFQSGHKQARDTEQKFYPGAAAQPEHNPTDTTED